MKSLGPLERRLNKAEAELQQSGEEDTEFVETKTEWIGPEGKVESSGKRKVPRSEAPDLSWLDDEESDEYQEDLGTRHLRITRYTLFDSEKAKAHWSLDYFDGSSHIEGDLYLTSEGILCEHIPNKSPDCKRISPTEALKKYQHILSSEAVEEIRNFCGLDSPGG